VAIVLHHTIIRSRNRERSAAFFADLLGLEVGDPTGPFVPVEVNEHLTFDFDDRFEFDAGHYAFHVDDATFDALLSRIVGSDIEYGSGPGRWMDREINHLGGGRGVYVRDPDGHRYELFTAVPTFSAEGLMLNGHSPNGHSPNGDGSADVTSDDATEATADPVVG
jgi:catechol 2,3-dioxygenase-like lactoylglutathione lyase family enzyme